MTFDFNIILGNSGSDGPTGDDLFQYQTEDVAMLRLYQNPPFRRGYLQALKQIAEGPLAPGRADSFMDDNYRSFVENRIQASSPAPIKSWIKRRQEYIQKELAKAAVPFAITSNGGRDFSTNQSLVTLEGTAPLEVRQIQVNGLAYPVTWLLNPAGQPVVWRVRVPLQSGPNALQVAGYDRQGQVLTNAAGQVQVTFTGVSERPQDHVVINEILYDALGSGAEFIELYNTSSRSSFDLSGVRLEGVDHEFGTGTLIAPRGFLVVAAHRPSFSAAYPGIGVAGEYLGQLARQGEVLRLLSPTGAVWDEVSYSWQAPWPAAAAGGGSSLQLIDALQDNSRAGNWGAGIGAFKATPGRDNSVRSFLPAFAPLWINEVQVNGNEGGWVELYNASSNRVSLDGLYLSDSTTNLARWALPSGVEVPARGYTVVRADGSSGELSANFKLGAAPGLVILAARMNGAARVLDFVDYPVVGAGHSFGAYPDGQGLERQELGTPTPGAANQAGGGVVTVVINEWMASNTQTLADPADGDFDDWFELYNTGGSAVDLGGYLLADNLTNSANGFVIPEGTVIGPRAYLLVWADSEAGQNRGGSNQVDLHVNFRLSQEGEAIGLFDPEGRLLSGVSFGPMAADTSEGRAGNRQGVLLYPTPGAANAPLANPGLEVSVLRLAEGQVQLLWKAAAGTRYRAEYRDDLRAGGSWTLLQEVVAEGPTASVTDGGAAAMPQRFYQVRQLP